MSRETAILKSVYEVVFLTCRFARRRFGKVDATVIEINKLSDNEISSVLFNEFALSTITPALTKKILTSSKGNPGSAISYLQKLKDMKMLNIDEANGACTLKDPESLSKFVSDDLKVKATHVYDKVDTRSKYILQLASVTGNSIPLALLKEMYVGGIGRKEGVKQRRFSKEVIPSKISRIQSIKEGTEDSNTVISRKLKEDAFYMRLNDLIEAKIMRMDYHKVTIVQEVSWKNVLSQSWSRF